MYGIGCYCRATDYHYRTICMVLAATVGPLTTIIGPYMVLAATVLCVN